MDQAYSTKVTYANLFTVKANFKALVYTCAAVTFQQLTGINVVLFNAQAIFEATGSDLDSAICTIIIGAVQFGSSVGTPLVVDRLNRRTILICSGIGTALTTVSKVYRKAKHIALVYHVIFGFELVNNNALRFAIRDI